MKGRGPPWGALCSEGKQNGFGITLFPHRIT